MGAHPNRPLPLTISEQQLIDLAGERAYRRGLEYFQAGAVQNLKPGRRKTTATVRGTTLYHVTLEHTQSQFSGYCDCPASEGIEFCKHCVAAALELARQHGLKAAMGEGKEEQRVRAYLQAQDKDKLVDIALELIGEDSQRLSRWALRAEAASGALKPATLKKRITKALPYRDQWGYAQVRRYFSAAEDLLDEVFALLPELPAADALKLVEYGYQRLNKALERIDDSGGYRFSVEHALQDQLAAALARWEQALSDKVEYLLAVVDWQYDVTPNVARLLTAPELEEAFYARADQLWEQRQGVVSWPLQSLLEDRAEQCEDWGRLIDYKGATARHPHQYGELVDLTLRCGEVDAAEHWLERMQVTADSPYETLAWREKQVAVLRARGELSAALEEQWKLFRERMSTADYAILAELSEAAGEGRQACYERAEALLIASAGRNHVKFGRLPNEPLIDFYLHQGQIDAAIGVAEEQPVALPQLTKLAARAFSEQPDAAFGLYERAIVAVTEASNHSRYGAVIEMLQELSAHVQAADDSALETRFASLLKRLRTEFKRKTKLMAMLDRAFSDN